MSSYRAWPTLAALTLTFACGSETFVDGSPGKTALEDGGTATDGAAATDATVGGDATTPGACPNGMIKTPQTCIDAREVTTGEYLAFALQVGPSDLTKLPPGCAYKTKADDFKTSVPAALPTLPMSNVDWCDALVYCTQRGKRLCSKNEWLDACTKGGAQKVPYMPQPTGASNTAGRCVLKESAVRSTTRPDNTCEGGYSGLFDMLGNVEEWIDACEGPSDNATCIALGSAFNDDLELLDSTCDSEFEVARNVRRNDVGFRCCK